MTTVKEEMYDVLIVGAGLAGLSAAKVIDSTELSYCVLEAAGRAGGKVKSGCNNQGDYCLELGAQFVNPDMTEMVRLIEESGMTLSETETGAGSVFLNAKTLSPINDFIESVDDKLGREDTKAKRSLSETIEGWKISDEEKRIAKSFFTEEATVDTDSILADSFFDASERYDSQLDDLSHQASGQLNTLIDHMIESLKQPVLFNHAVDSVSKQEDSYKLTVSSGQSYYAKAVIIAIPPTVAKAVAFDEQLSEYYQPLLDSYVDGAVIKHTFSYPKAFWQELQLKDSLVSVEGVVFSNYRGLSISDSSKKGEAPRLTAFTGGELAKKWAKKSEAERKAFILKRLRSVFGTEAEHYSDFRESIWVDHPYCGGGYSAQIHTKGRPDAAHKLRSPHGQFVFASTEVAEAFPGFMEGAVRSGNRAAKAMIKY
ncbi:MAG: FAD-dependent oxidoreductase [Alkalibacterium sp.]|nr:FAD-dependent oxidoreductase [Alkalibacterium sp.]